MENFAITGGKVSCGIQEMVLATPRGSGPWLKDLYIAG